MFGKQMMRIPIFQLIGKEHKYNKMEENKKNESINLSTEFKFSLKTILITFAGIATLLWGYHEKVLLPQIEDVEERVIDLKGDIEKIDTKVEKILLNMAGIGEFRKENTQPSEKLLESDRTAGSLGSSE